MGPQLAGQQGPPGYMSPMPATGSQRISGAERLQPHLDHSAHLRAHHFASQKTAINSRSALEGVAVQAGKLWEYVDDLHPVRELAHRYAL